jgi:hypothetical protein
MNLGGLSFTSKYPIDRLAMPQPLTGTRVIPGDTLFSSFTVNHTAGQAFIPFIRYSIDGGISWQENGAPFVEDVNIPGLGVRPVDTVSMTARCNNDLVEIFEVNNNTASRNVMWEVYGVVKDV